MKKILMTVALCAAGAISAPAMAADCALTVESNDAMQFNAKNIDVPKSCKKFSDHAPITIGYDLKLG